ncbi:MAG: hypothetical protein EOP49_52430 [Sphingobacteriales bacterium]|nr:MAG: hypothetical protein EOP49_52430 [Sphingobacteriales bacterium]
MPEDQYVVIKDHNIKFIFAYTYPMLVPEDSTVEIVLVSASPYGEGLTLARDISFPKKWKYKNLFQQYFIDKVKEELQH